MTQTLTTRTVYRDEKTIIAVEPPTRHVMCIGSKFSEQHLADVPTMFTVFLIRLFGPRRQPYCHAIAASPVEPTFDTQLMYSIYPNTFHMWPCLGSGAAGFLGAIGEEEDWHSAINSVLVHWWGTRFHHAGGNGDMWASTSSYRGGIALNSWWKDFGADDWKGGLTALEELSNEELMAHDWSARMCPETGGEPGYYGHLRYKTIRDMVVESKTLVK